MILYQVTEEAQSDLFEIWQRIAADSPDLADRIEQEFHELFELLGRMPAMGHVRRDLTHQAVLFFPLYSFLVIYRPDPHPIRIIAVIRGRRNIKQMLNSRR